MRMNDSCKNHGRKIVMAFNHHGLQLARMLELATHAYLRKEGATPHPNALKHRLLHDGKRDERFGERVGM